VSEGPESREGADELGVAEAPPEEASEDGAGAEAAADEGASEEHAPGELRIPDGVGVFAGAPNGSRRYVGVVVSRFNGDITTRLLEGALAALEEAGVDRARVDVMQVPGAFELPLGAMALAKTRRYACVVALGCVIRGDTPHFEYVAQEAASGLQLAALETGVPVAFGVLTCDSRLQAESRAGGRHGNKGAEAAHSALEMADVFARLRSDAVTANRQ
jgi:6,7-dimethyl-8-ribityllumazine synthase